MVLSSSMIRGAFQGPVFAWGRRRLPRNLCGLMLRQQSESPLGARACALPLPRPTGGVWRCDCRMDFLGVGCLEQSALPAEASSMAFVTCPLTLR